MSASALRRCGRRRRWALVALPVAGLGAVAAVVVAGGAGGGAGGSGGEGGGRSVARGTEVVERRTLVDSATIDGTLGYGSSRPVLDRRGGTLTWLPRTGAVIRPGERIFEVDGEPVILLNGSTPAWRTLTSGDEGADVLQLERNLAALGYDPGTVDDDYTSATAAAVRAWQEDWGMAKTGRVELGDVLFLPGARRVSKLTGTLGESGGGGGGNQGASWDGGELTTAYAVDTTATTPTTPTAPQTTPQTTPTTPGTTPTQPPTRTQPPARTQPSATPPGRTTPGATTPPAQPGGGQPAGSGGGRDGGQPAGSGAGRPAASGSGGDGQPAGSDGGGGDGSGSGDGAGSNPGTEVLQTTATRRVVTADVDAADQTLARVGARATVELPGGRRLRGRIVKVGTVATGGSGDEGGAPGGDGASDPTVPVTIELRSERGVGRLDQAPVIVELARETRRDVLAVPVTALIARPGGGYAVSVVRGAARREVPVRPGLFADGYVELTGGSVRAGDRVAVPR